ncbi:MAG: type II secretion system F family protein [Polyangiaceae bacterium]|nr:type II secretion system F family protein [Polyangiaceae bacterium]
MYPTLMVGIGFLVLGILMTQVVPNLVQSFATAGQELPWNTQLLILVSNVLSSTEMVGAIVGFIIFVLGSRGLKDEKAESQKVVDQQREKVAKEKREARGERETKTVAPPKKGEINGMLAGAICVLFIGVILMFVVKSIPAYFTGMGIGVVFGLIVGRFFRFLGTDAGRLWRDTMSLRLPILGPLLKMLSVARFARTLATLLKSGVPLLKAMDIVKNVLENARLSQIVEEASVAIREGSGIAQTFKRNREFPPIVVHMIAVGEKSGQLENMLENVAKAYDTQVETKVQGLTSLLEPLIIVFMGGAVGFVAFSILMPLMQSNDFVQ